MNTVAQFQSFSEELAEVSLPRESARRIEHRVIEFPKLNLKVALLGDRHRIADRIGHLRE